MHADAKNIIETADEDSLIVTAVVVAEVVYGLRQAGYERPKIAQAILFALNLPTMHVESRRATMAAVDLYGNRGLDFADCYILERSVEAKDGVVTQDKKLAKAREAR